MLLLLSRKSFFAILLLNQFLIGILLNGANAGLHRAMDANNDNQTDANGHFNNFMNSFAMPSLMNSATGNSQQSRMGRRGSSSTMANSCTTTDGAAGTCMTRFNCMRLGGSVKGYCGTYGVCCETNLQCGQYSKLKRTIITNPSTYAMNDCQYMILPYSTNVCQIHIQFEKFEMVQPTLTGDDLVCSDYFRVDKFRLCGSNSGQHLYTTFNVGAGAEQTTIDFYIPSGLSRNTWRLIVTQLECPKVKRRTNSYLPFLGQNNIEDLRTIFSAHNSDLDILAPQGCDQFYTDATGTIKTFNYNFNDKTLYMSDLPYVICVKAQPGATLIEYIVKDFSLTTEVMTSPGYNEDCYSSIYTEGRREDYLMIPQSFMPNSPLTRGTYYCGTSLTGNTLVYASLPFIMYFSNDDKTDATDTGFEISYRVRSVIM